MKTVLLRLEGPLQSWATQSKLGIRDTDAEPSKSGVLGLVAAAMGIPRDDDAAVQRLSELELAVRVDRPGSVLRDYHTAGGGVFRGDRGYSVHGIKKGQAVLSERFYLQDASFLAALGGPASFIDEIAAALSNPRWPLFLGRRSCPPSRPVLSGVSDGTPVRAVETSERSASQRRQDEPPPKLRAVVECGPSEGDPRYDVPVSFRPDRRRYAVRYVKDRWVDPPSEQDPEDDRG